MKRCIDLFFSSVGLLFAWPIILIAGIAIRVNSAGPVIFSQSRIGRKNECFTFYKLRTMVVGTAEAGTHEIPLASVTSVGRFLRASKIDELPQLWNVWKGEMSLVGPRPCLPVQKELISEREKLGVFQTLPGITGLAQVEGIDMSDPMRLAKRDADYIAERSLWLDLEILFRTAIRKRRIPHGGKNNPDEAENQGMSS